MTTPGFASTSGEGSDYGEIGEGRPLEPDTPEPPTTTASPGGATIRTLPPPIIDELKGTPEDNAVLAGLLKYLDEEIIALESEQQEKLKEWAEIEKGYRARPEGIKTEPFEGANNDVTPVIAMAVDPIVARLDTGIFKQEPVFTLKALRKSFAKYMDSLNVWTEYYQRHKLKLRQVSQPRIVEFVKLGTMAFKTIYDREEYEVQTYDRKADWKVIKKKVKRFCGPRVVGIPIGDLLFHPGYEDIQKCPCVFERQRYLFGDLKTADMAGKLTNVEKLVGQETSQRTELEEVRQTLEKHKEGVITRFSKINDVYEGWIDYILKEGEAPSRLIVTYHYHTRTLMQARLNWYFHQRKAYTVIPYMRTNESLYGIGIGENVLPFQEQITSWQQMAQDNAYIANIRMFIAQKDAPIEEVPRLYSGRVFFVEDPSKDFIPFAAGDIYPSTLAERQNLFGLVEKRTGVSDYLTGRESPIIGSRATATSTLALIEQGTKRVEEVLENIRVGMAEILENCYYIWFQFGFDGLDDVVFGNDQIAKDLQEFINQVTEDNINGALAVDLTATDASMSKAAKQQMQLALIQTMMQYLEKLLQAAAEAIQAEKMGAPEFKEAVIEVMDSARKMFTDLLHDYDVRNPDDYLPDLGKILNGEATAAGNGTGAGGPPRVDGGVAVQPQLPPGGPVSRGPVPGVPALPGSGGIPGGGSPPPGTLTGVA